MTASPRTLAARAALAAISICVVIDARAATITGRVIDESGRGLAGIEVSAYVEQQECCGPPSATRSGPNGDFVLDAPAGTYAVFAAGHSIWNPAAARVDTSSGNASGILLRLEAGLPRYLPGEVPNARRIAVGTPAQDGVTRFVGAAGAVPASASVILHTLETGHFVMVDAAADGSFVADLFAPAGASVSIEADPIGIVAQQILMEARFGGEGTQAPLDGTIVHVPEPASTGSGVAVSAIGRLGYGGMKTPPWMFRGTLNRTTAVAGDVLRVQGTLEAWGTVLRDVTSLEVNAVFQLEPVSDDAGSRGPANAFFSSPLLTPTGFPIERRGGFGYAAQQFATFVLKPTGADRLGASVDVSLTVPSSIIAGWYRPVIILFPKTEIFQPRDETILEADKLTRQRRGSFYLPTVRIGSPGPARLHWALLLDRFAQGTHGVAAVEDRDQFALTSRIAAQGDTLVIPRNDPFSGKPIVYSFEPYLPQISVGDRGIAPSVPFIPFRFPSGTLTMRMHTPAGAVISAGPSPFVQSRGSTDVSRNGTAVGRGGGHLTDAYQIITGDPAFRLPFATDGLYVIELEGEIEDVWGNRWMGGGTYRLLVGDPIAIDTTLLPGTPLETGDALSVGGVIAGHGVCDVDVEVSFAPGSTRNLQRWSSRTRSNRFGHFHSPMAVRFAEAGEYRLDMTATCDGGTTSGNRTWGGVVAGPGTSVIAHGRRGIDDQTSPRQQWFFRSQTNASPIGQNHVFFPFHSGDVAWMQKADAAITTITLQEQPPGEITSILRQRWGVASSFDPRAVDGEIPLFSSQPEFLDPIVDLSKVDLWGYSYRSVQRPGIRVREQVTEDDVPSLYWRFREEYGRQPGVGTRGDEPNDFKFQFGAAVLHGAALSSPRYAIYGSLFVLVPDSDQGGGTRIFPPFQGKGGGPSGGPLFTLRGREIDLFFLPTGVKPGSILQTFERASFAGYSAPTLPSKIEVVVTSPSGETHTIAGQANRIGWFYRPESDFQVDESGRWRAKAKIVFDGVLPSGGQVTQPFPTGDVLGTQNGEFWFFVVDPKAPPLEVTATSSTMMTGPNGRRYVRPADDAVTFLISPPSGIANAELHYVVTMPGFVLEQGSTTQLRYVYDAEKLAADFPNLDLYDSNGFAGADTITISFLLTGTDAGGARKAFARQITIQGEELLMPAQPVGPSRRRSARH